MKVLLVGAFDESEIVLAPIKVGRELFRNLANKQIEVIYLCYFDDGSKYSRIQKLFGFEKVNTRIYRCGIFPLIFFVIKYKPDIIQIINADAFYLPLYLLKRIRKFRVAYLSHSIISYHIKNFLQISCYQKLRLKLIEKVVLKFSDLLQVFSKAEARFLINYLSVKEEKIKIVDNGINNIELKKEYFEHTDTIKIIFIGSIYRKEKAFDFLLNALAEINKPVVLNVFSYKQEESENIEIPGNVQLNLGNPLAEIELREEFCKNDLFIIPSKIDYFPLALLEAMDTGILFISSDRVGLTERFPESFNKFIVPFGNAEKLKDKILELHNLDYIEKNRLAEQIREFAYKFSWETVSKQYVKLFNEVL
jgi:glycosyltransferase involved in cell wall biosynthesis